MSDTATEYRQLVAVGFNHHVAEALDENGYTAEAAKMLGAPEAFRLFLEWNGIIGFNEMITSALDNCRSVCDA